LRCGAGLLLARPDDAGVGDLERNVTEETSLKDRALPQPDPAETPTPLFPMIMKP
jgi:hypothetical protein